MAIKFVCVQCGSDEVTRDAIASWSVPDQKWELIDVMDNADCNNCCSETRLYSQEVKNGDQVREAD